jgi:hypothetical protein
MLLLATKCTIYNNFFLLKFLKFLPPNTWLILELKLITLIVIATLKTHRLT